MYKNKISLLLIASFFTVKIQAQNIFPSTGNVGIGTTTPSALLHINTGNYGNILLGANGSAAPNLGHLITHESFDHSFNIWSSPIGSGAKLFTIAQNGNVGIGGVSQPIGKLDVLGNLYLRNTDYPSLFFRSENAPSTKMACLHFDAYGANPTNEFRIGRFNKSTGAWEGNIVNIDMDAPGASFNVTNEGKIGVGTSTPGYQLEVMNGGIYSNQGPLLVSKNSNEGGMIQLYNHTKTGTACLTFNMQCRVVKL